MSSTPTASPTVMEQLKERTWPLHTATERHPVQRGVLTGRLPREAYAAVLEQTLHLHAALSDRLRALRGDGRLGRVVFDEAFIEAHAAEDARFFGGSTAAEPTPATRAAVERIRSADALTLLGSHYVIEGSKNGGRFIAKALRRVYGLEGEQGTRSLDPHGEDQPRVWARFKEAMNALDLSEAEQGAVVEGADAMFRDMIAIFDDLARRPDIRPIAEAIAGEPAAPHH